MAPTTPNAVTPFPFRRPSSLTRPVYADDDAPQRPLPAPRMPTASLLPLPTKRILDLAEAAEYVGVSVTLFLEEVEKGMWPRPMRRGASGRRVTWDVRALDAAADRHLGLPLPNLVAADQVPSVAAAEQDILRKLRA